MEQARRNAADAWTKAGAAAAAVETPPPPAPPPPAAPAVETPPPAAPAAPATPAAPAVVATIDYLEALLEEGEPEKVTKKLQIPLTARIPLDVNGKVEFLPFKDVRANGMRERDYHAKTTEVAEARKQLEEHAARLVADNARLAARQQYHLDEVKRFQDAQKDPEQHERFMAHLERMETDPEYARIYADALKGRERAAVDAGDEAARDQESIRQGFASAVTWISDIGKEDKFKYVDQERVRQIYSTALAGGKAMLAEKDVRRIFETEAQYLDKSLTPFQRQIADLQAQVAAKAAADAATAHNATTEHALARDKAPPVTTGQPAAPATPNSQLGKGKSTRDLPEVNAAWNRQR